MEFLKNLWNKIFNFLDYNKDGSVNKQDATDAVGDVKEEVAKAKAKVKNRVKRVKEEVQDVKDAVSDAVDHVGDISDAAKGKPRKGRKPKAKK